MRTVEEIVDKIITYRTDLEKIRSLGQNGSMTETALQTLYWVLGA
jgi:hypothetical protein